ncbi:rhodopsin, GQ-coupled-like, partial [Orbicella faveolata]|uniref:rhodopsin, GQ-coupled-like n=1 Tax=Orbicella faveolata TaxID=48498 RepID=UPI0009E2D057
YYHYKLHPQCSTDAHTCSLRSPSTILLCSLAVSDLLVGLVVQPVYIPTKLKENGSLLKALYVMVPFASGGSVLIMTLISVDRFLALHYHMRYTNLMTARRAIYASVLLWLISFLLSLISFWKMDAYYFIAAVGIIACLLVSAVCYISIYCIVRKHHLQTHVQQQTVSRKPANFNQNMLRSMKCAKNTFIFYIVMVLCYIPWFISMFLSAIFPNQWIYALVLADTAAFLNSSINPFLYCWHLRKLRAAVVKTTKLMLCKKVEN